MLLKKKNNFELLPHAITMARITFVFGDYTSEINTIRLLWIVSECISIHHIRIGARMRIVTIAIAKILRDVEQMLAGEKRGSQPRPGATYSILFAITGERRSRRAYARSSRN